jgi:hypothetical protein
LAVIKPGGGVGTVTGGGIDCGAVCSGHYSYNAEVDLSASAGACSVCDPLVYTSSVYSGSATITAAYQGTAGGTIHIQAYMFPEDLILDRPVDVALEGGWDCEYQQIISAAGVRSLTISDGIVGFQNGTFVIGD